MLDGCDAMDIPNWNELRWLLQKEDFIYIADCKLCSSKNLAYIDENNGYFITIIPKFHKESTSFMDYIKTNKVKWENAFEIRHSRKKKEINKFRTYEAGKNTKGYRVISYRIFAGSNTILNVSCGEDLCRTGLKASGR